MHCFSQTKGTASGSIGHTILPWYEEAFVLSLAWAGQGRSSVFARRLYTQYSFQNATASSFSCTCRSLNFYWRHCTLHHARRIVRRTSHQHRTSSVSRAQSAWCLSFGDLTSSLESPRLFSLFVSGRFQRKLCTRSEVDLVSNTFSQRWNSRS